MKANSFFNRDLSWLSFNERVLMEAENENVPLLERIRFLSIFSSNLDEFYRVRMPVLMAMDNFDDRSGLDNPFYKARFLINRQQEKFGHILANQLLPALKKRQVHWLYHEAVPDFLQDQAASIFYNEVLAYIRISGKDKTEDSFFAENNKLYQAVVLSDASGAETLALLTVPSDVLPRLYLLSHGDGQFVMFLEDIIKENLAYLFPEQHVSGVYHIKVTRNAELNLKEEIGQDITRALEEELKKRDLGFATRFLCQPGIPLRHLYQIIYRLNLSKAAIVEGGYYHNLKDLESFPLRDAALSYPKWPAVPVLRLQQHDTLFDHILQKDLMVHAPYQQYDPVLRFFNEAAADPHTLEIYVTLYRVASQSRIVNALMTAARNGRKVTVMVELKARFDEANNLRWAAQLKAAGVKLIYSNTRLKVHAKVALVKRKAGGRVQYLGLLATGNLNESTARFYTDHILLTANAELLKEVRLLFTALSRKKKAALPEKPLQFNHLLVAQFNLQQRFLELMEREITHAKAGKPAAITIKLNNLEEQVLISKLYEASGAGVKISLIVRSVCCLVPGVPGQSENITVKRIVDRYLEHGRVFIFHNLGSPDVFMGSADWMNRNIYTRIEVCFPVYDPDLKQTLTEIINLQLEDDVQAVALNCELQNTAVPEQHHIRSQQAIYRLLADTRTSLNYASL